MADLEHVLSIRLTTKQFRKLNKYRKLKEKQLHVKISAAAAVRLILDGWQV